jgi:nitronate monooxygenase
VTSQTPPGCTPPGCTQPGWTRTAVTERLGLSVPIIQGPFGGGLSSVELTAAVSDAGGLGSFGAHHLDGAQIVALAEAIRARTAGPFALNLWLPYEGSDELQLSAVQYADHAAAYSSYFRELGIEPPPPPERYAPTFADQLAGLFDARPPVFSFVYGIPEPNVVAGCRRAGIVTAGTATSVAEARALEQAGVDLVVASAFEAGGHRVAFQRSPEAGLMGALALIPQVVDAVRVPVIAAGGIVDARGVVAALTLGAQAVQLGTAFLACAESGANAVHRQRLFSRDAADTVLTRVFSGRLARGIRNRLADEAERLPIAPYPVQNWLMGQLKRAAADHGRYDLMSLWAGQGTPLLRHQRARELIAALQEEVSAIYRAAGELA